MKKMKKALALLLAVMTVLSLAACGAKKDDAGTDNAVRSCADDSFRDILCQSRWSGYDVRRSAEHHHRHIPWVYFF